MKSKKYIAAIALLAVLSSFSVKKCSKNIVVEKLAYVIENLDKATFHPIRTGWNFDYGFSKGGALNKFEYIRSLFSFQELQEMLDYSIYVSGPHTDSSLNLQSKFSFGHYNPRFVSDLKLHINQLTENKSFVEHTKPILEKYNFIKLLQGYQLVYNETKLHESEFNSIKKLYVDGLRNRTWEENSYSMYLSETIKTGAYLNWGATSYHFWLRRDIDGTKEGWNEIITAILKAYQ